MGFDAWAVKTEYQRLNLSFPAVNDFLFDLLLDPNTGYDEDLEDDDMWGGSWDNNGLYEFSRVGLRKRANNWANDKNLSQADKARLRRWIRNLPWEDGDLITLHLGN